MSLALKLQLRRGQRARLVNAPAGFQINAEVVEDADADLVLAFVANGRELASHGKSTIEAGRADRLAWIAYPKAGQLGTDLNRDILRDALLEVGVQPVRQVAIDATWSALRVRPA